MSKPAWGNIGAWAEEAERAEAEEREAAPKTSASFPSLKESVTTAKQKKKTKMTLQEFKLQHQGSTASNRLTEEEMLSLPTGPRQRSAEDMRSGRLGGGFSNYGSRMGSGNYNSNRQREFEPRRSYGYEEDERKGMSSLSRASEFNQPSRADEVDNWASTKKPVMFERGRPEIRASRMNSSGGSGGGGGVGIPSRADEAGIWMSLKAPPLQTNQQDKSSSFWSGSSSAEPNRWAGNSQSIASVSSRPETDNWRRNEQISVSDASKIESEVVEKVIKPNPFGSARPREEVLAQKGLDWKKLDLDIDEKKPRAVDTSRPVSSKSSRPGSSHSSRNGGLPPPPPAAMIEAVERQKPKANPFGDAKPREVLLEEKGIDWRKIDLELERQQINRIETDEENKLKEDIENLRRELLEISGEEKANLEDQLMQKESNLKELVRQLDDKVHYTQKTHERPSSGSGRSTGFPERPPSAPGYHEGPRRGYAERPPSQPGAYGGRQSCSHDRPLSRSGSHEDTRDAYPARSSFTQEPTDFHHNGRPHSHGASSSWTKPHDDRRSFQGGGRRGGFSGSRDVNRSESKW